jgi:predicted regulator of Ras-like GTPase activity (Roadblock/LC7/MglB family)
MAESYESWITMIEEDLARLGVGRPEARRDTGRAIVAGIDGLIIQRRVFRSDSRVSERTIAALFAAALATGT